MDYDVIVIGAGAMGAATLEQLSRRGARVLGIEQSSVPNESGSSAGDTRLIRKAYFEHPDYVPLLERAYELWRDLETRSGEALLFPVGALYIGPPEGELMAGSFAAARAHDLPLACLSPAQVRARYPRFRVPPGHVAGFEPEAGYVMAARAIAACATLALGQGARLLAHTRVEGWQASAAGVEVATSAGTFRGERLVITAGSWSGGLLGLSQLSLTVTRQAMFWVWPRRPAQFTADRYPCWAAESPGYPGVFYGFPGGVGGARQAGVKLAHHHPGPPCLPDAVRRAPDAAEFQRLQDAVAPFLPGLDGTMLAGVTCMYTMSRDQHFVVDQHPQHSNVTFAGGFSGHGFKFAPVMGELLADYALTGATALPAEFLRIGRRALGDPADTPP